MALIVKKQINIYTFHQYRVKGYEITIQVRCKLRLHHFATFKFLKGSLSDSSSCKSTKGTLYKWSPFYMTRLSIYQNDFWKPFLYEQWISSTPKTSLSSERKQKIGNFSTSFRNYKFAHTKTYHWRKQFASIYFHRLISIRVRILNQASCHAIFPI